MDDKELILGQYQAYSLELCIAVCVLFIHSFDSCIRANPCYRCIWYGCIGAMVVKH